MAKKRHSVEQVVRKLREAEVELANGARVKEVLCSAKSPSRPVPKLGPFEIGQISSLVSVFATVPRAAGSTIVLGGRVVTMQKTT